MKTSELQGPDLDRAVAPSGYIALRVTCPVCGRKAGEVCSDPRGNARWGKPHKTRLNLARKQNED